MYIIHFSCTGHLVTGLSIRCGQFPREYKAAPDNPVLVRPILTFLVRPQFYSPGADMRTTLRGSRGYRRGDIVSEGPKYRHYHIIYQSSPYNNISAPISHNCRYVRQYFPPLIQLTISGAMATLSTRKERSSFFL